MDFYGPINDKMILVIVDAFSEWVEIVVMKKAGGPRLIKACKLLFARFGLPDEIVTDNGSQFVGEEFQDFLKIVGVKFRPVTSYHPASNGEAERTVKTI